MSADEVLSAVYRAGIVLRAEGNRLRYDAPEGALTPELRDALAQHKAALLAALAPVREFESFHGGLTVPRPAWDLASGLEARGFRLTVNDHHEISSAPSEGLTPEDRAGIARWKHHLGAMVAYPCPEVA